MAAARGAGGGGHEVGELSEALRAEIEKALGRRWEKVVFEDRPDFGDAGAVFLAERLRGNTVVEKITKLAGSAQWAHVRWRSR